ncbi:MAG: M3 family metallopeptidase [Bacteriovoracaceae bacterium]
MKSVKNPFESLELKKSFSLHNIEQYKERLEVLVDFPVSTKDNLLSFFDAKDELDKLYENEACEAYFLKTIDISNDDYKNRFEFFNQEITPVYQDYREKLDRKVLSSPELEKLGDKYSILKRNIVNDLELFNKDNIDLEKQMNKISSEITEIQGGLTGLWEGEELPLTLIYPYMKDANRETRKKAYEIVRKAKLEVFDSIDSRFDQLLDLRNQIAKNSGFDNYIDFRFKEMRRFDWGRSDCHKFHAAIKKHIIPLAKLMASQKKENLSLDSYKYYDTGVDHEGREPLRIYEKGDTSSFIEGTGKIIKAIDDELYGYFKRIRDNNLLDLDARKNKAPGGYMCRYPIYELASVFYGGSGLSHDLMVLLHELGHCFHYFLGKDVKPQTLQEWSAEVAEGGSMSMEYIGLENMHEYLDEESCKRIKDNKLRSVIRLLISCSMGDEFQHWLYEHPGHSSEERQMKYRELSNEYYSEVDQCGQEEIVGKTGWQYMHILQAPFYLIDYSISELLALSVWDSYKRSPELGLKYYKEGCSLAASKSVPEIYKAFGTTLNFSEEAIKPLAERLKSELNL